MACEGPPPPKKQALDTGQGLEQGLGGFQEESAERSLWDSVTAIQDKLEICLSHNCLCSVSDDEVRTFIQKINSTCFSNPGENVHLALPKSAAKIHRRTNTRTKFSRWKFWLRSSFWKKLPSLTSVHDSCLLYLGFLSWAGTTFHDQLVKGSVCQALHAAVRFEIYFIIPLQPLESRFIIMCLRSHQWTILHLFKYMCKIG